MVLYVPGYSEKDAGLDMGDSAITETVGWGGFVIGGAPGILSLVGGTPEEGAGLYPRNEERLPSPPIPPTACPLSALPVHPIGIDIRKVVQTGITPIIDTAIAHKDPGYPKIGAGLVRAPLECFKKALIAFSRKYQAQ